MNARRFPSRRGPAVAAVLLLLHLLQACNSNNLAGGSSEVDNPQIKVAFIDSMGSSVAFTGSLSLFLSDQNPTLDPDALVKIQLDADTVAFISAANLKKAGMAASFNLVAQGDSGNGALLKGFSYDTTTRKVTVNGMAAANLVVPLVSLVRYTATVSLEVNGPERVFVPGTPFQAVVVSDSFAFVDLPQGVFPLRCYSSGGVEREFRDSVDTRKKDHHFDLDTSGPPIDRPPPPETQLSVSAGADQSVASNAQITLSGQVTGIHSDDKRLGVLWRQIPPDSTGTWAWIQNPSSLNTRVFAYPGVFRFVLSATVGPKKAQDTIVVVVQQQQFETSFTKPDADWQLWGGYPINVEWFGADNENLRLEFSRDSAATWELVANNVMSGKGYNGFYSQFPGYWWTVPTQPAANCFLRFRKNGGTVATSARFSIVTPPPPGQGPHY